MRAKKVIPETPAERTSALSARLEGQEPTDPGNDIDDRLDALLADHKDMGARPEQEPSNGDNDTLGDIHEDTYPLRKKAKK